MGNPLLRRPPDTYRGRFAPSPSGLLHFGSLVAALASFLRARSQQGKWLVRIEDIDPPREQPGADKAILNTLEAFGLHWDETVLYQSKQAELYREVMHYLAEENLTYHCTCTRAQIKTMGGIYTGVCRLQQRAPDNAAIRLINQYGINAFDDKIQGKVIANKALAEEDFTIHRKDGLFAYQLAVVVDDIHQNITEVVRGCDLLEPTARQLTFFKTLGFNAPAYAHVPLAITDEGYKLSKQNKAPAIDTSNPQPTLVAALAFLGQQPPADLAQSSVEQILQWAIEHWQLANIPAKQEIMLPE